MCVIFTPTVIPVIVEPAGILEMLIVLEIPVVLLSGIGVEVALDPFVDALPPGAVALISKVVVPAQMLKLSTEADGAAGIYVSTVTVTGVVTDQH